MKPLYLLAAATALFLAFALVRANAEKPAVHPESKEDTSLPLFNGKDLTGWQSRTGEDPGAGWSATDATLARTAKSGDIWTAERYGDFILELDFKTDGNSGIFIRADNPTNPVQTGIEIQVDRPGGPSKHSVGAIYDLVPPTKNLGKDDDWNHIKITAHDNNLSVELNGETIAEMDIDLWVEPLKNPDGSKNKFKTALKDFKREGHIGFQDHGHNVAYRNIRLTPIK